MVAKTPPKTVEKSGANDENTVSSAEKTIVPPENNVRKPKVVQKPPAPPTYRGRKAKTVRKYAQELTAKTKIKSATLGESGLDDMIERVAKFAETRDEINPSLSREEKRLLTYKADRERNAIRARSLTSLAREIGPLPSGNINWERRLATKSDFLTFCTTYLPNTFRLGWSVAHQKVAEKLQEACNGPAYYALAMPRGSGKTSFARAGIVWAQSFGYKRMIINVAAIDEKATQTLDFIKRAIGMNPTYVQDFPEIGYPIFRNMMISNRFNSNYVLNQFALHMEVKSDILKLPCCLLSEEEAKPYLDNDPDTITYLPEFNAWMCKSAGSVIKSTGIRGGLRGDSLGHPITLETLRPDLILLDDVQKDVDADNYDTVIKLSETIDGAVRNMEGPDVALSIMFVGTVIRESDLTNEYLDKSKHPEYRGERYKMVLEWPEGLTDEEIDPDSTIGQHWTTYKDLRITSLSEHGDIRLATEYYKENQEIMSKGFVVSWNDRFPRNKGIIDAYQHAMELRFENARIFLAEQQQQGKPANDNTLPVLNPSRFAAKQHSQEKGVIPLGCTEIVAMIDVQDEILFYCVLAAKPDLTTYIIDYGTYPDIPTRWFTKADTQQWNLLSSLLFRDYPEAKREWGDASGKLRANKDPKIYHALSLGVKHLAQKVYHIDNAAKTPKTISRIGIDTQGPRAEAVKRFCREWSSGTILIQGKESIIHAKDYVVPIMGRYISPRERQYEDYTMVPGHLFEHQLNPTVREAKWLYRPDPSGQYILYVDVNRSKTFTMARIEAAPGSVGSCSLYFSPLPNAHTLFAQHVCNSEFPIEAIQGGVRKIEWKVRDHKPDNDWLDCLSGCMTLASFSGCSIRLEEDLSNSTVGEKVISPEKSLRELWETKQSTV